MYDDHYGLSGRAFQLTPDPRFWFDTATHRKAMAYLGYGLSQGEGFVVITGEPGVGKTTLVGHLLGEIDVERLNVIKLVSSQIGADDLLRMVSAGLDVDPKGASKAAMLADIERGLHAVARSGRRTLLIVDEAQALPLESLEELRMLSNFQAGGYPLLQIFLLGQPEFRAMLHNPKLEQLRQRVIAMHHLEPMEAAEVEPYLMHRLSCVGWNGKPRFTHDAVTAIYRWSGGSPRKINQLVSRVLLFGAVERIETFGAAELAAVIDDLAVDSPFPHAPRQEEATAESIEHPVEEPVVEPADESPAEASAIEGIERDEIAPLPMGTPTPSAPAEPRPIRAEPRIVPNEPRPIQVEPRVAAGEPFELRPIRAEAEIEALGIETDVVRAQEEAQPVEVDIEELAPVAEEVAEPSADALGQRIAMLEKQMQEQDEALRRVLTLLVDWVETGDMSRRPDLSTIRGTAA
ncbi:ExeA family protein [Sphingomonas sp. M1-B02]|uniref:ExeA family protein n=1 Tax=Sphingomonas sp. M1-B02 TaxID=3114300 RepID=UPI00223EF9BC|nr:AAA family ATPase [Sphingomonas sp. S6-11]UZK66493.1 AAA family ATPase [Sphingomonas sp. S6-11]